VAPPDAAVDHYEAQTESTGLVLLAARRYWDLFITASADFDAAWSELGPALELIVSAGQQAVVDQASTYVPAVLSELNIAADLEARVVLDQLIGIASDGRELGSLLYEPIIGTRGALGAGMPMQDAIDLGRKQLDTIVHTQVQDAGRAAESLETVARPRVGGYVRMLTPPSCARCAILAGKFYRWNTGFDRHPRCDCVHIPASENVAGDLRTDAAQMARDGQIGWRRPDGSIRPGLSEADRKAIVEGGADPAKVVNAHRGMYTEAGRKLTTEATRNGRKIRLRPEEIYKQANGRADALRLLRRFGYVE
jgi:hypothetical protein